MAESDSPIPPENYPAWTVDIAAAITRKIAYRHQLNVGDLNAVAGFMDDLHGRIEKYGVQADGLRVTSYKLKKAAERLAALSNELTALATEVAIHGRD
jgi:hypoxanthine-guanine phosphoribosyltransferase